MDTSYLAGEKPVTQLTTESVSLEQATELIIERARQLVKQLIDNRGHDKPPFLSEEFARLLGFKKIVKADLGKTSAVLLRFHDGPVIKVNQNHNLARQNFSCAHEIAHNLLRELKIELDTENISYRTFNPQAHGIAISKTISRARERLCNAAAAELLMPEPVFRKYLSNFGVSIYAIERLANIFGVAISATARRIAEVSEEPCITLFWQPQLRTKGLRLAWSVDSETKSTWKASYVPKYTSIRLPSTLYKAYENESPVKSNIQFKYGNIKKRFPIESKGFGRGENRYVISLAFPDR